ncbi:nucleolin [Tripterygium wilfordii]|uniref:Nucleolin n=1 Tax=Tripterygium wilfordii TaxID=458696 RepID=A0A7J7DER9_TRIWF|nr:heterogeneous nuclear ribonucleoprotein Q-like [Tripterygium wilfordii]XP_038706628.1 heterogeneous nuclear ribonucleoprotein Q-like [Tripterygium wilfordii]XP_038706629.1 heterogeneous nuclear ribonucleoprotein Q-like [Tripterygium wilfordii]KAF5744875.1 nucleolin [Tripterygium wilfordii]
MPRPKESASKTAEPVDLEKPIESDEKVDYDEENDSMDEEVEYEEIEEEVEVEVEEVEEEEEIEEVEEEVEEEDGQYDDGASGDKPNVDNVSQKHVELLALPPHGSEVYIGGIPPDCSEEELKVFCESIGEVTEVRIMKDKNSSGNKGFAFVTFRNLELASRAIDELKNTEFKGIKIRCSTAQAKNRLFIGNIPRSWGEEDLRKAVTDVGPGVTAVQLVKDMKNSSNNRGFAFIDYYNHACAEYSRQTMINPKFMLGDNVPTISWADPKNADSSASSQVKAVYVKNLPKNVTQDQLKDLFEHHGKITKVVLPTAKSGHENNRIGFVHFAERSSTMKALKNTEKYELDGRVLECSLAKQQLDHKSVGGSNLQKAGLLPTYPPRGGYGMVGGAFGALGVGYGAAGFSQPLMYGIGSTPASMPMMPMLLPDGRIGYVLQQPGAQLLSPPLHQRNNSRSGNVGASNFGSSSKGKKGEDRRYRPY